MSLSKYLEDLQEKLKASDPMSKYIEDFKGSNAPQFIGKGPEKRREMAIAAKLGAEREAQNEEKYSDTGWKSPERKPGAKTKNVSGRLARQGMKQAEKEAKKVQEENKAYKAQDKESIRTTGMNLNQRSKMYDDIQKKLKDQEEEYRKQGILPPKNEEVELDEGKYGSFRVRSTSGTFGGPKLPRRSYVPQGNQDPRTGLPLGFSPPKETDPKKTKNEEVDESIGSAIGGAIGQYTGSKIGMDGPGRAHGELAGRAIEYHVRKFAKKIKDKFTKKDNAVNSSFEHDEDSTPINELDEPTLTKFATRARFSSNPKHREAAKQAMEKLKAKKKQETNNEEVEQVDEVLDSAGKFLNYTTRAAASGLASAVMGTGKFGKRKEGIKKAVEKAKAKVNTEEVELDEEGFSPRGHRNLATHHFNKAKELIDKADSAENRGDSYGADHLNDVAGKHMTAYRAHKEASTDPKKSAEAHKASYEANDMIVDESVELGEDGKLKGGAKDPCWKGYQMVGTKKKGGREVPNCVPREETELKTFKALREELNGNR